MWQHSGKVCYKGCFISQFLFLVIRVYFYIFFINAVHETNPKDDEQWECKLCGKNCFFKVSFTKHMRTHDPGWKGPNVCDICGK